MTPTHLTQEDQIRALPCWAGIQSIEPLHGGLSNESHLVTDLSGQYVVRFGRDYPFHHVERAREIMTARAAYEAGFAPKVHYSAPGVMVSAFIQGRTLNAANVCDEYERVAQVVRQFHLYMAGHVSGTGFMFWVFHVIRDYARTLSVRNGEWQDRLGGFVALANELEAVQVPLPIVFGHNDLLPANFIDDGKRLWLIDFEYAGFSTAMFDIAGIAANADMDPDQSQALLDCYFNLSAMDGAGAINKNALLRSFTAMQCAATLREAMWGMVSEVHLKTPGVDFNAYAHENLARLDRALDNYRRIYS